MCMCGVYMCGMCGVCVGRVCIYVVCACSCRTCTYGVCICL